MTEPKPDCDLFFRPAGAASDRATGRGYPSPVRLFVLVGAAIVFAEIAVMVLLSRVEIRSLYVEALLDAFVLACIVAPVGYVFMYRPMAAHIAARQKAERVLREANESLESRVEERTRTLVDVNRRLEQEIADRIRYEEQLSLAAQVFENTIEGIVITDAQGTIQNVNRSYTEITGYSSDEAVGQNPRMLKSKHHDRAFYEDMWSTLLANGVWKGEIWNRRKNGEAYPQWLSITAIRDPSGRVAHYIGVFHDITERKQVQEQLHYQAYHDPLTGLPNRTLFNDRLKMAVAHGKRHHQHLSLLFIDLDNFKDINDSLGHETGDGCLKEVAQKLLATCRNEDTVARLGGDEFTIILPDTRNPDDAVSLAGRVLHAFKTPCLVGDHEIHVDASIGITFFPEEGDTVDALVRNADIALYRAKESGRGTYQVFQPHLQEEIQQRVRLEKDLRRALDQGELLLYYQPKVDPVTGTFDAVEALVRWRKSDGTIVSPGQFIPVAERSGLILPMGRYVMQMACTEVAGWHAKGHAIHVSVNVSARQFLEDDLERMVLETLSRTGLPATALELEVTESLFMKDREKVASVLRRLREQGVRVALDDFGTGYSSLAYLKRLPVDTVKVDRSFVKDIPDSDYDMALTSTVLAMAENLGLSVVVEGVETEAQICFLTDKGCRCIQGYYFSPPVPPEKLLAFLEQGRRTGRWVDPVQNA